MQKIPVIKVFKESFVHIFKNMPSWMRLSFAPLIVGVLGFLLPILLYAASRKFAPVDSNFWNQITDQKIITSNIFFTLGNIIFIVTSWIMQYCIIINFYRYAALNEGGNHWWTLPLNKRFLKMIIYSFFFSLLIIGYIFFSIGALFIIHNLFKDQAVNFISIILLGVFDLYLLFRIFLLFLLVAIDDSAPIKTSWRLMKGNVLRLSILLFLILFSFATVGILLTIFIHNFILLGVDFLFIQDFPNNLKEGFLTILLFVFLLAFLILLCLAVISKALALVRQSLMERSSLDLNQIGALANHHI